MESSLNETKSTGSMTAIAVGIVVVLIIIIALYQRNKTTDVVEVTPVTNPPVMDNTQGTSTNPDGIPTQATSTDAVQPVQAAYKDGTYSAVGDYRSPGGPENIGVTLTLANNIVTDASVEPKAERPMSVRFQGMFASGFKAMVVGKNINDLHLDKVSGSSLTPKGFNDAVEKIKTEATIGA